MTKVQLSNDPTIANEVVKFLSLNSKFEKVKQIELDNVELKTEFKNAHKDIKEAVKSVSTMNNKLDQYKSTIESLKKRFTILENKCQSRDNAEDN
jgi:predicted nuclease with TOPRIM domain